MIALHPKLKARLAGLHKPQPRITIPEWAGKSVDFSLAPSYDTPIRTYFDPNFMKLWIEPAEALTNPRVKEVWVWKPARACVSECLMLNAIRHSVAVNPQRILYASGDQKSTERFMEKRIKDGLRCSLETAEKLSRARVLEHEIYFEDMDLVVTWPKNKMAFKQSGYPLILCDEFSTWSENAPDMMRKRTDTYAFSHICGISSMDPEQKHASIQDPIYLAWSEGDQRYWMMHDPQSDKRFKFVMGGQAYKFGLKWSKKAQDSTGLWDLNEVAKSAYYVTPGGRRIEPEERADYVDEGHWVPTNDKAEDGIWSYQTNVFYMPWKSGEFGAIAKAFLKAKRKNKHALRVFIYESLAEVYDNDIESTRDDDLYSRSTEYKKGERISESEKYTELYIGKGTTAFMTVDVQKGHLWYVNREWIDGGDSGLMNYGYAVTWDEIEKEANDKKVERVLVDSNYPNRRQEVREYCLNYAAWPTIGSGKLRNSIIKKDAIDPFEGTDRAGDKRNLIDQYTFQVDVFKAELMDMMRGESTKLWHLYDHIEHEYIIQAGAWQCINGIWSCKRGRVNNDHLADCEVLQLLAATITGIYRIEWIPTIEDADAEVA